MTMLLEMIIGEYLLREGCIVFLRKYDDIFKLKTCYFFAVPTGTGNIQPRRRRGDIFIKPQ